MEGLVTNSVYLLKVLFLVNAEQLGQFVALRNKFSIFKIV